MGEASAKFSILLGDIGTFDCRISQLPRKQDVIDYFRWRNEDAHRNALNAHCYWLLRGKGESAINASKKIEGKSTAFKNELLFEHEINFNELPSWQKRGIGIYWKEYQKEGWNPVKEKVEFAIRNELVVDFEIPMGEEYNRFIESLIKE